MNKFERVQNALNLKEVDRPPVGFWFHFSGAEGSGQACVDAHLRYYNSIDVDLVKIMCDGFFTYPLDFPIEKPSDWRKLEPLKADHPFIEEQVDRVRKVKAGLKEKRMVLYNVFAPFSSIRFGTSDELVMGHLKEDPSAIAYALEAISRSNALLCERLLTDAECDGLYYCVQGGEKDRFSIEEYRTLITPSDKYVLEAANKIKDDNILHCCGWAGIENNLEDWQDYPAKAINYAVYVEEVPLPQGRALFGNKAVLGGFDNRKTGLIYAGPLDAIKAETRRLINECAFPGFMIGADCTLPGDIDMQRIAAVVEAAKE